MQTIRFRNGMWSALRNSWRRVWGWVPETTVLPSLSCNKSIMIYSIKLYWHLDLVLLSNKNQLFMFEIELWRCETESDRSPEHMALQFRTIRWRSRWKPRTELFHCQRFQLESVELNRIDWIAYFVNTNYMRQSSSQPIRHQPSTCPEPSLG